MSFTVYALHAPGDEKRFRYVGVTVNHGTRVNNHVSDAMQARRRNWELTARQAWTLELLDRDQRPVLVVLESGIGKRRRIEREKHWIATLRAEGHGLLNADMSEVRRRQRRQPKVWAEPDPAALGSDAGVESATSEHRARA